MAAHLSWRARAVLAGALMAAPLAAAGQPVLDPTVPPAATAAVPDGDAGLRGGGPAASRLQMVIRGPGEARAAVLDGELVRIGDRVRINGVEARVIAISDHALTYARGGQRETLELLPGSKVTVAARRCRKEPC
jgi:hypothetical protein